MSSVPSSMRWRRRRSANRPQYSLVRSLTAPNLSPYFLTLSQVSDSVFLLGTGGSGSVQVMGLDALFSFSTTMQNGIKLIVDAEDRANGIAQWKAEVCCA